jgi:hypothetical protein
MQLNVIKMKMKNKSTIRSLFLIKFLSLSLLALIFCGCDNTSDSVFNNNTPTLKTNVLDDTASLPFIGIRHFETRPGVSGNATPSWFVQIQKNRDVTFCYMQVDQGDESKPITTALYYAGKYTKYIWCYFDQDDFPRRFEITDKIIYEVDSSCQRLSLPECCGFDEDDTTCNCDGDLWIMTENDFTSNYVDSLFRSGSPR